MKQLLSPRQAALSMGVSESSLKRWCDRGVLQTQRTAGGHRKIPVSAVVHFVRENSRELVRPEVIGLPNRIGTPDQSLSSAIEPMARALTNGDAELCRQIAFGSYLAGQSLAHICDELLSPTLALIGDGWNHGEVEVFEEHRAVEIVVRLLHEVSKFRGRLPFSSVVVHYPANCGSRFNSPQFATTLASW